MSKGLSQGGLYGITDSTLLPDTRLLEAVEAALRGGMRLLQYRDKSANATLRLKQAQALLSLCRDYHCQLLINDDVPLCQRIGADGVHLGQQDTKLTEARSLLGQQAIIGITCHASLELAQQAQADGADYLAFGAFFPSSTKPLASPAPLSILQQAQPLGLPLVAIGGITLERAPTVLQAGAQWLAVVGDLFSAPSAALIQARAQAYQHLFSAAPAAPSVLP